jgi:hypothetical protein
MEIDNKTDWDTVDLKRVFKKALARLGFRPYLLRIVVTYRPSVLYSIGSIRREDPAGISHAMWASEKRKTLIVQVPSSEIYAPDIVRAIYSQFPQAPQIGNPLLEGYEASWWANCPWAIALPIRRRKHG